MKTIEEYCDELASCARAYHFGTKDPENFFDASEKILDICNVLKKEYSEYPELVEKMLDDASEPVRRVAAFCLLESFSCSDETEKKALKIIVDFLEDSYGPQHIVWLTWLEGYERKTQKNSGYKLRAELSPLTENYADKWLKIARENQSKLAFISETPVYPFDSLNFVTGEDSEQDEDEEFPY